MRCFVGFLPLKKCLKFIENFEFSLKKEFNMIWYLKTLKCGTLKLLTFTGISDASLLITVKYKKEVFFYITKFDPKFGSTSAR